MRLVIVLGLAALATAAHAQTDACRHTVFGRARCESAPIPAQPPALDEAGASAAPGAIALPPQAAIDPRLMAPFDCNRAQKITLGAQVCSARKTAAAHRRVGELAARGRCEEAGRAARATGDLEFAARVQTYCQDRRR